MDPYQRAIAKAVEHIHNEQLPDGSFLSLSSPDQNNFLDAKSYKTTFFTSNILLCLQSINDDFFSPLFKKQLQDIKTKAIDFLLSQKTEHCSFNYWAKDAEKYGSLPDDLDDTFAALAAISNYDGDLVTGHDLAMIMHLLIACETGEGGPFTTWLVPQGAPASWKGADIVVNSTIGYFLSLIDVCLPNIDNFIVQTASKDGLSSRYYPSPYQTAYFISRFIKVKDDIGHASKDDVAKILEKNILQAEKPTNILERALLISSLANIGHRTELISEASTALLTTLNNNGFQPHAFCSDPSQDKKRYYAGSSALTAAFCIEALVNNSSVFPKSITVEEKPKIHEHIQAAARRQCQELGPELRTIALRQIERTADKKITSLAYEFQSTVNNKGRSMPTDITEKLATANLYGWMAYTIYDDLLDYEGDARLIPCANFFLRKFVDAYDGLDRRIAGVKMIMRAMMDSMDNANAWEQIHCRSTSLADDITRQRLPDFNHYDNLAFRSIGHALGPLAGLLSVGYLNGSDEHQHLEKLFHHYLIARQLNDDAHDWEEDLVHGRLNSIGTLVLESFQKSHDRPDEKIGLVDALPKLRKIFWEETVVKTADLILFQIAAARDAKGRSSLFSETNFLENALLELESIAKQTITQQAKTMEFLRYYSLSELHGINL